MAQGPVTGLLFPASTGWSDAVEWGRRAEMSGFSRIWVEDGRAPLALVGGLARRLAVRLGIVVDPARRAPTVLAKEVTSLDVISGGRLEVAAPRTPEGREALDVVAAMSSGDPFTWEGTIGSASGARCRPAAVQRPHPPLWFVAGQPGQPADPLPSGWREAGLGLIGLEPR